MVTAVFAFSRASFAVCISFLESEKALGVSGTGQLFLNILLDNTSFCQYVHAYVTSDQPAINLHGDVLKSPNHQINHPLPPNFLAIQ